MQSSTAADTATSSALPELPALEPGLQLLEVDADATGTLHSLVLDHLLLSGGRARWVDTQGRIAPQHLARIAPSPRVLDRVQVARAFTPYQHYTLIEQLADCVDEGLSLVVVPALDGLYRDESALRRGRHEGQQLLLHALAALDRLARQHESSVLLTRTRADGFGRPIANAAAGLIHCERTRFGPRFVVDNRTDTENAGDDEAGGFETLVYPLMNGLVQTTLAFWREVIAARIPTLRARGYGRCTHRHYVDALGGERVR